MVTGLVSAVDWHVSDTLVIIPWTSVDRQISIKFHKLIIDYKQNQV